VVGPIEVFSTATRYLRERQPDAPPAYSTEILASRAGAVTMGSGIGLVANRSYRSVRGGIDTLIVCGGNARAAAADPALLRWLQRMEPKVRRLASVCTGAFILAAAGLLNGRRATTHWLSAPALARDYPEITVEPDAIFVRDGHLYTSAGVTAGMDLALALVEEDHGRDVALMVARLLVLFLKRPGGQSQFSSQLAVQMLPSGPLKGLPEWIVEHLGEDLTVESLAARVAMSPRNFARVFRKETGMTPAKFVERARVERARRELEDSTAPVETVAVVCGFGSAERMRRTFQRHLRVVPQEYRRRFENAA
jgi:transcriptional regulator GlxA family with amidase domain